jgi:DNA-binding transcriptional MerR regulator
MLTLKVLGSRQMIRSYTINELEELTAVNKRTISDYITKGLLSGPSHRGRGAVYSQRDFNILRVIPKLRTLLKDEYGSLKSIGRFLAQLSIPDIQTLAARDTERSFTVEVRRLRLRLSLMGLMPHVSPEKFDEVLDRLSPEQICSIDSGRVQIGTVIDLGELFAYENEMSGNAGAKGHTNGFSANPSHHEDTDRLPKLSAELFSERDLEETIPARSAASELKAAAKDNSANSSETKKMLALKLDEIANRLDRVEQMLDYEADR